MHILRAIEAFSLAFHLEHLILIDAVVASDVAFFFSMSVIQHEDEEYTQYKQYMQYTCECTRMASCT